MRPNQSLVAVSFMVISDSQIVNDYFVWFVLLAGDDEMAKGLRQLRVTRHHPES